MPQERFQRNEICAHQAERQRRPLDYRQEEAPATPHPPEYMPSGSRASLPGGVLRGRWRSGEGLIPSSWLASPHVLWVPTLPSIEHVWWEELLP